MSDRPIIRLGRVEFRSDDRVFGIKNEDRFSHIYIIGKTGTGKSTLLETMALQDLEHGKGFALIDPHGDLAERVAFPQRVKPIPSTSTPPIRRSHTGTIRCDRSDKNSFRSLPPG